MVSLLAACRPAHYLIHFLLPVVALEVGTKGNLGVTARVDDVSGTWQEITTNVNTMVRVSVLNRETNAQDLPAAGRQSNDTSSSFCSDLGRSYSGRL